MKTTNLSINKNELIILAARPGCGKTTFAINLFTNWTSYSRLYCSLEMTSANMKNKIRQCYDPSFNNSLKNAKICDDPAKINLTWLEDQLKTGKYDMIFIDHIQIFNAPIRTLTRDLKQLALKYNVAIVALSQLNRTAATEEPESWMLRGSGTIEQDADQIWFIKEHGLKIAKNRNGQCGEIPMEHDFSTGKFWFEDKRQYYIDLCYNIYKRCMEDDKYWSSWDSDKDLEEVERFDFQMWLNTCALIRSEKTRERYKKGSKYCPYGDFVQLI